MTIARQIAAVSTSIENRTRAAEFVNLAKCFLRSRGELAEAQPIAKRIGASAGVVEALKSAIAAGTTNASSDWASPIANLSTAFAASLAGFSAWDFVFNDSGFQKIPMNTRVVAVTLGATATTPAEAVPKPISKLTLDAPSLTPKNSSAIIVVSVELAESATAAAFALVGDTLRRACAQAVDAAFVGELLANTGITSITSAGLTPADFISDLGDALVALDLQSDSRVYLICSPAITKVIAMMTSAGSQLTFPNVTVLGGSLAGITVTTSSAIPSDTIALVDAKAFAADQGPIMLDRAEYASLQLDDDPTSGAKNLTNLWQSNLRAIRCERYWASATVRPNSAAIISSLSA